MIQLRLTFDDPTGDHPAPPPSACPQPGCGGGRIRHWQTVAKPVRGSASGTVTAERYICLDCRRTFRVYPAGIDRGTVPAAVKHWAAALHALGLPYRDVSRALAVLGVDLGKSRVQMLAKPLAGAGKPRPAWLGAVLERVEIEGDVTNEGDGTIAGEGMHDDTSAGARATAPSGGVQAERRAWVWLDGRRHALRRVVNARGQAALVVDGVARDLFYIVDAWADAMLAQHGVHAAVAYAGDTNRCRDDAGSGSPWSDLGWAGGPPPAGDARAPDRDPDAPGLDPDAADLAAAVTVADPGGPPSDPSSMSFLNPPGDPPPPPSIAPLPERPDRRPAPRWASIGTSPGFGPSRRDRAHGIGPGAPLGAPAPLVDRARHGAERLTDPESKRPGGACRASRAPSAPRVAA